MQVADYPLGADVTSYESRVSVAGEVRDVTDWSLDREMSGGLPSALDVTGSGITQATGAITFAGDDAQSNLRTPLNSAWGWVPSPDDAVTIEVRVLGSQVWTRVFTGVIDSVSGDNSSGVVAKIIDSMDTLDKPFRSPTLCRVMPPVQGSNSQEYIYMELTALTIIDKIARQAGFYATPMSEFGVLLNAPLMGSTYPTAGTLLTSRRFTTSSDENFSKFPQIAASPWGFALSDTLATYAVGSYAATEPYMLSLMATKAHTGTGRVTLSFETGNISLNIVGSQVRAYVNNVLVASMGRGEGETFTLVLRGSTVSLKSDTDRTGVSATVTDKPTGYTTGATVFADASAYIGGATICRPQNTGYDHVSSSRPRTAFYDTSQSALMSFMDAMPSFDGSRTLRSVLEEIAEAKLSSVWFDENGFLHWANAPALEARKESRDVTTLDDILELGWKTSNLQKASAVIVQGRSPNISVSTNHSRLLYQPTNFDTVNNGETVNIFAEPGTDENWLMPYLAFNKVGASSASFSAVNDSTASVQGLYYAKKASSDEAPIYGDYVSSAVSSLGYEKVLFSYTASNIPAGYEGVFGIPEDNPNVARRHMGKALPRIMGGGKITWTDVQSEKVLDSAASRAIQHDAGVWSSRSGFETTVLDRLRDYLIDKVQNPLPVIDSLPIVPDVRLQMGDTLTITSEKLLGVKVKVIVLGISLSFDADDGMRMVLIVRIVSVISKSITFEQFDALLPSAAMTFEQVDELYEDETTFQQLNSDPTPWEV